jgi:ADP-heptose:LPS heptosyltransferase
MKRTPHNSQWMIISVNKPMLWSRSEDEVWMLNPPRRYIFNANQISSLEDHIETMSDLKSSKEYRHLQGNANLSKARILVERYRDRGIGDLLFLSGVFNYLQHVSGNEAKIDAYALVDRGQILAGNTAINHKTTLAGPVQYDDLKLYNWHWFIDTVTEYDEEKDQLNVYDALYKSIGLDPKNIGPQFKRPTITLTDKDFKNLDSLFYFIWNDKHIDFRRTPYYVVSPLSHSSLRSMGYSTWLQVIAELSKRKPVIVVGQVREGKMPSTDMSFGAFNEQLTSMSQSSPVFNLMGSTPLRLVMGLIAKAYAVVCLDSGPLYIAQACRVPAVSIWGTHHPGTRIGYDAHYVDLAVWNSDACNLSPCFAYINFPVSKCPRGESQNVCECMQLTTTDMIMSKIDKIDSSGSQTFRVYQKGQKV